MKLFYYPGASSLAVHIVLRETGQEFELEKVDIRTGETESGQDYLAINPHGYVPALVLEDGEVVTEVVVIMQYLADNSTGTGLAPHPGSRERLRLQQRLNYLTTEVHKSFSPLFRDSSEDEKTAAVASVRRHFGYLNDVLEKRDWLLGGQYSLADIYLFVLANWTQPVGIGLDAWPHIRSLSEKIAVRPAVLQAMKTEGLI